MAPPLFDDDPLHADHPVPITELARRFLLPESTARYYCKRFLPWLPHVGEGKRRRFLPEAVPVFAAIVQGMQEHKDARHVARLLGDPPAAPPASQSQPLAPRSQSQSQPHAVRGTRVGSLAVIQPTALHPQELGALAHAVHQQSQALEAIAATLAAMQAQQQEITSLRQALVRREEEAATLREELRRLALLQDSAEKTHQQDMEQLRKWLAALAREQQKGRGEAGQ
ncbi:MAG: hypothetical protein LDL30_05405 [Desulfovibrio sp.]|nr:hypothetical protein [Desulfovibrio sp.]MCA1986156.1 hypothetical protein [Desulfovibrio sp.]